MGKMNPADTLNEIARQIMETAGTDDGPADWAATIKALLARIRRHKAREPMEAILLRLGADNVLSRVRGDINETATNDAAAMVVAAQHPSAATIRKGLSSIVNSGQGLYGHYIGAKRLGDMTKAELESHLHTERKKHRTRGIELAWIAAIIKALPGPKDVVRKTLTLSELAELQQQATKDAA